MPLRSKEGLVLLACCCLVFLFFVWFFRRCFYRCLCCCRGPRPTSTPSSPLLLPPSLHHHASQDFGRYKHINPPYVMRTTTTQLFVPTTSNPNTIHQPVESFTVSNSHPMAAAWYDEEASAPVYHDRQNNAVVVAEPWQDKQTPKGMNPKYY